MADPASGPRPAIAIDIASGDVERAIVEAIAYADVFDYPLTAAQVHRYLIGAFSSPLTVRALLSSLVGSGLLLQRGDLFMLSGRGHLAGLRRRRAAFARRLWPIGIRYGHALGRLPYVRMVAITGSLTLDNVEAESDIDYLVVTKAGRVWIGRGMSNLLRRLAQRRGITLCPNFVLSEESLEIRERNLYTAHELVQMVPVTGYAVYQRMIELNAWTAEFLPNALKPLPALPHEEGDKPVLSLCVEAALNTPVGAWLDRLERDRLKRKMASRAESLAEAVYSRSCCKDHTRPHGERVLASYRKRLEMLKVRAT